MCRLIDWSLVIKYINYHYYSPDHLYIPNSPWNMSIDWLIDWSIDLCPAENKLCIFMSKPTSIQFYWCRKQEDPEKITDLSQVTDKLYHIILYTSAWLRFEITTSVVIGTDCICSCISNYHTITATKAPIFLLHIYIYYWSWFTHEYT
jgi:hypothetical protein